MEKVGHCFACGAEAAKKCGKCRNVSYCSAECQRNDWQQHKKICGVGVGTIVFGKDITIATPSTAPGYVADHAIENRTLVGVVWPEIPKYEDQVKRMHKQGSRCFFNIEVMPQEGPPPVKIRSIVVEDSSRAKELATTSGSSKLVQFCDSYDQRVSTPILVWCREPWSCYTFLPVMPWNNAAFEAGLKK